MVDKPIAILRCGILISALVALPVVAQVAEPNSPSHEDVSAGANFQPPLDTMDTSIPCESSTRNYFQFYRDLWEEKGPLLNECGLGGLIDFKQLQIFDPFGRILSAIKGAVCGAIRDQVHDPFAALLNQPVDQANRWTSATNNQYSDWVDESARNAADAIYDPSERYNMDSMRINRGLDGSSDPETESGSSINVGTGPSSSIPPVDPVTPPQTSPETIKIDTGNNGINGEVEINLNEVFEQDWTDIYNVYDNN